MQKLQFVLYISGMSGRSERTILNLRRMLEEQSGIDYELGICNVLEEPQIAEKEKILATPTLVKVLPKPSCRIVGDLTEADKVLPYLGISFGRSAEGKKGG